MEEFPNYVIDCSPVQEVHSMVNIVVLFDKVDIGSRRKQLLQTEMCGV